MRYVANLEHDLKLDGYVNELTGDDGVWSWDKLHVCCGMKMS